MDLSRMLPTVALFLLLLPVLTSTAEVLADSASVTVKVDHDDGGKTGKHHMRNLLTALSEEGCSAIFHDASSEAPAQLLFDSRPVSIAKYERTNYRLIARAKTLQGELSVRGAILVHASTGIDDLNTLQGERIAFMGKKSLIGYQLPLQLLHDAGVTEQRDAFYYVDNHIGTLSMLLHSDVYVAVTAEPLARKWAEYNDLSIVAVTDEVETGGWWMHRSLSEEKMKRCAQALGGLDRSRHKALPAWIDGFAIFLSSPQDLLSQ
ncbi:MAG: PhnD/SsuA/transferrin family substrate-binding protein [Sedimenticola sp.]